MTTGFEGEINFRSPECDPSGGAMRNFQADSEQPPAPALFPVVTESPLWYAIQTRSRSEKKVATHLELKGVRVFLPLLSRLHRWSDRNKRVQLPLFPGYAFVQIVLTPNAYHSVLQTPGITRFVGKSGRNPLPVPKKEIDDVQRILENNHPCTSLPLLRAGQRVRIRGGCLDGLEGILLAQTNNRSLAVSVELIQRSVAISIEGFDVEIVDSPNKAPAANSRRGAGVR